MSGEAMRTHVGNSNELVRICLMLLVAVGAGALQRAAAQVSSASLLPDKREFVSWERPLEFARTYYADNQDRKASDANPGTRDLPFLTINHATQLLKPGERVVVMWGAYRERIVPARGGTGPESMISYEAAPGATVVVKGSRVVKGGWRRSTAYLLGWAKQPEARPRIYKLDLDGLDFQGYNTFGMANVMGDRQYLKPKPEELRPHLLRRGMVFLDGHRFQQVELYREPASRDDACWVEHNGLKHRVRLRGDANPADRLVEVVIQE